MPDDPRRVSDRAADAIGSIMPDGSIYAGVSPDTGKPMYTMAPDAPQIMEFEDARAYVSRLDSHGHNDWRLPSEAELQVLFDSRAAIGGFTARLHRVLLILVFQLVQQNGSLVPAVYRWLYTRHC